MLHGGRSDQPCRMHLILDTLSANPALVDNQSRPSNIQSASTFHLAYKFYHYNRLDKLMLPHKSNASADSVKCSGGINLAKCFVPKLQGNRARPAVLYHYREAPAITSEHNNLWIFRSNTDREFSQGHSGISPAWLPYIKACLCKVSIPS